MSLPVTIIGDQEIVGFDYPKLLKTLGLNP